MIIFKTTGDIRKYLNRLRADRKKIGFVPTMGALHQGHLSLIRKSKAENDVSVASIFVNPTQFNEKQDLNDYPRPIEKDIEQLIGLGNDILFLPTVEEIYPNKTESRVNVDFGYLLQTMEATFRKGHFDGVAMVVKRLLDIVAPHTLYMGQKDYQQFLLVKTMIERLGLPVKIKMGETIREPDGLAMSSRNLLLNEKERTAAKSISKALFYARGNIKRMSLEEVKAGSKKILEGSKLLKTEYFEIVSADDLRPVESASGTTSIAICTAARAGKVRLIDNVIIY